MTKPLLVLALASLALGCSELDNCPDSASYAVEVGEYEAGAAPAAAGAGGAGDDAAAAASLSYESSAWDERRSRFPAKTCLRFRHNLGTTPEVVTSYVSFTALGSDVTENAGNQGRIKCVDDYEIVIKNDTCEDSFFIRVAAHASGASSTGQHCLDVDSDGCGLE
jgi:hypothetical protein